MKTTDHLLLGQFLVEQGSFPSLRQHRRAFLLGCVEPDYNLFSYLRGMHHHEKLRGHNAENSFEFLSHCCADFRKNGIYSQWDYFRLGTMIHYAADAFTAPHNSFWTGSLPEHCSYEAELHQEFAELLKNAHPDVVSYREYVPLHKAYCADTPGMETDFRYILIVCLSLLKKYLPGTAKSEGDIYEGLDYNRLVQAGH